MKCMAYKPRRPSSVELLKIPLGSWTMKWKSVFGFWPPWLGILWVSYIWALGLYS